MHRCAEPTSGSPFQPFRRRCAQKFNLWWIAAFKTTSGSSFANSSHLACSSFDGLRNAMRGAAEWLAPRGNLASLLLLPLRRVFPRRLALELRLRIYAWRVDARTWCRLNAHATESLRGGQARARRLNAPRAPCRALRPPPEDAVHEPGPLLGDLHEASDEADGMPAA